MATFNEHLSGISRYPIPLRTIVEVATRRGIALTAEAEQEDLLGKAYRLARADLLLWLSFAPDISQGCQTFSLTDEQRGRMRGEANALYRELEPTQMEVMPTFGYKGDRL